MLPRTPLQASLDAIRADIKAGHLGMKKELSGFCETIKQDLREELGNFRRRTHHIQQRGGGDGGYAEEGDTNS